MFRINSEVALKLVLLFTAINSSIFIAFSPGIVGRLVIAVFMNVAGLLLFLSFNRLKNGFSEVHKYFQVVFLFLLLWSVGVFTRGMTFDSVNLISLFGHYLMGWAWLTPLAIVFGFTVSNWLLVFDFLKVLLLVSMFLSLLVFIRNDLATGMLELLVLFPVLLMTFFYQTKGTRFVAALSLIVFLVLSYFASQRINVIFSSLFLLFLMVGYFKRKETNRVVRIVIVCSISVGVLFFFVNSDFIVASIMGHETLSVDTRTFLFEELFSDLDSLALLIGRGALGTYFSPYFSQLFYSGIEGGDWMHRQVNEVGYLQMILKGGWIMLILHWIMLIPASYLGMFKSNNIIGKMCGFYILSYLILWSVSYYSVFSAEYILLWMAVGTAISPVARNFTNSEVFGRKYE